MAGKKKNYSDQEIIKAILAGGVQREHCIAYVYDKHIRFVFKVKNQLRLPMEIVRDAYSDAVVSLSEQISDYKFRGDSKLSTYLYRIFYNRCVDQLRKEKSKPLTILEEMPDLPETALSALQKIINRDKVEQIYSIMSKLGDRCKQILTDWAYHGYTMDEIAQRAGLKNAESAVSQKYKCFSKLKRKLRAHHLSAEE